MGTDRGRFLHGCILSVTCNGMHVPDGLVPTIWHPNRTTQFRDCGVSRGRYREGTQVKTLSSETLNRDLCLVAESVFVFRAANCVVPTQMSNSQGLFRHP